MFASRVMACAPKGSELHAAAMETFDLLLEALEAPAVGLLRERSALKVWAALHGVVMLAEQGLLTGQIGQYQPGGTGRRYRRADQTGAVGRHRGGWQERLIGIDRAGQIIQELGRRSRSFAAYLTFHFLGEHIMASHDGARALKGKVALVTGAGRGLGRAFAEKLAGMGADVAIHGMRENGPAEYGEGSTLTAVAEEVAAAHGVRTLRVLGDLTLGADIARVVETATQELGPIDILVHNAGGDIAAKGGKPDPNDAIGIKEEDVRAVLDRNLLSTILTCQAVAQEMMQRRQGRIVTIGSVAAFKGRTNGSIYAVAKAGMTHYTRCLADQLRSYDITVNCIAPGDTRTGRFLGTRAVDQNRLVETGTLDRIATVDEVARVVEVFAGPLGAFVSGQVLRVDGGGQCWAA